MTVAELIAHLESLGDEYQELQVWYWGHDECEPARCVKVATAPWTGIERVVIE